MQPDPGWAEVRYPRHDRRPISRPFEALLSQAQAAAGKPRAWVTCQACDHGQMVPPCGAQCPKCLALVWAK